MPHDAHPAGATGVVAAICMLVALELAGGPRICAAGASAESGGAARFDLKIGSQPLEQALQEFARQSGLQILFFSQVTAGLRAPALAGEFTLQGALDRLLGGSGLSYRVINADTVAIRQSVSGAPPGITAAAGSAAKPSPTDAPAE